MKENHLVWLCDFLQSLIQILNTTEWHLVPRAYDNHMKTSSYQLTIEIKNWKTEFTCLHVDLFSKILEEMDFSTCKTFWYLTNSRSVGNSNGLFFFFHLCKFYSISFLYLLYLIALLLQLLQEKLKHISK